MRIVIYCLTCGRAKPDDPHIVRQRIGDARFGVLVGRFRCRCNSRLAVLLPWYAPTPAAWVQCDEGKAALVPEAGGAGEAIAAAAASHPRPPEFNFRLDNWTANGTLDRTLALIDNLPIAHAAFDRAVMEFPKAALTLRNGTRAIRTSDRPDVRLVE
jgi:hypothetical protein